MAVSATPLLSAQDILAGLARAVETRPAGTAGGSGNAASGETGTSAGAVTDPSQITSSAGSLVPLPAARLTPEAMTAALLPPDQALAKGAHPPDTSAPATPPVLAIRFGSGSATPDASAAMQLGELCTALRNYEGRVRIVGHTDAGGDAAYNMALSEARATEVSAYLTGPCALDPARIESAGAGETRPLLPDTPHAAANRRVEVVPIE